MGNDGVSSGPKRSSQSGSRLMGNSKSSDADVNGRRISEGCSCRISAALSWGRSTTRSVRRLPWSMRRGLEAPEDVAQEMIVSLVEAAKGPMTAKGWGAAGSLMTWARSPLTDKSPWAPKVLMKHSLPSKELNFCNLRVNSCWLVPAGRAILMVVLEVASILSFRQPKRSSARTLIRTLGAIAFIKTVTKVSFESDGE